MKLKMIPTNKLAVLSAAFCAVVLGPGNPPGVPDGGTTVMLLGAALGALGMARRFLKA